MKQRLGGGFRQAGVVAAPAITALETMIRRLPGDHENAEFLRRGLERLGIAVDRGGVLTNLVLADPSGVGITAEAFAAGLLAGGVKVKVCSARTVRMVAHNDLDRDGCSYILDRVKMLL